MKQIVRNYIVGFGIVCGITLAGPHQANAKDFELKTSENEAQGMVKLIDGSLKNDGIQSLPAACLWFGKLQQPNQLELMNE